MKAILSASVLVLTFGAGASGDVFDMPSGLTSLEFVTIGNPGNKGNTHYMSYPGSVGYIYNIGKYEVTTAQYVELLNSVAASDTYGLYNPSMWSDTSYGCGIQQIGNSGSYSYVVAADRANRPVNYVSFWDACRFANWLENDQLTGAQDASTTEDGAYTLNGYTGAGGGTIARNGGAWYFLPSKNEWYKAAYYDPNKAGGAGYWYYPTRSDTAPLHEAPPGHAEPPGSANYFTGGTWALGPPYYISEVGAYTLSPGPYGTFDQAGNVSEWADTVASTSEANRYLSGGSFQWGPVFLSTDVIAHNEPNTDSRDYGIRVAQIPEPVTLLVMTAGGLVPILSGFRRRRT